MIELSSRRRRIQAASQATIDRLGRHINERGRLCIIRAPPGSGKTYTLLEALRKAAEQSIRVAVAAQTNAQCDDICRRFVNHCPEARVWRFASPSATMPDDLDPRITWFTATHEIPVHSAIVVATAAKWSTVGAFEAFDFLLVDEAWQLAWADFMLLGVVSERFVLIGDPGQIAPVVSIPVERWETSPRAPHRPAPDLILADASIDKLSLELDACRRLPADSVDLVRPFYDFEFEAWADEAERFVRPTLAGGHELDAVLDQLSSASCSSIAVPTPSGGPPLELDEEIAGIAARVAVRALERECEAASDDTGEPTRLQPQDIGITATHRVVNSAILASLPAAYRNQDTGIRVDTPERWQGLERKLMVVVHPLSGVVHPSVFDLETGRLCVMASRHRSGMVIVSRDHVPDTLRSYIPWAEQAVGRPDAAGRGHHQHMQLWQTLENRDLVSQLSR